jgi:hypothetical protein
VRDWLGHELVVGDLVLYSSTSTLTGMNLGELTLLEPYKVQIRLKQPLNGVLTDGRLVTLHRGTSAFTSITKYFGDLDG